MAVQTEEGLAPLVREAYDPTRRAWGVLLIAFGLFCLAVFGIAYGVVRFSAAATTIEQAQVAVHAPSGVFVQERGMRTHGVIQDGRQLQEGDSILVTPDLDYGIAATVKLFEGSSVELWPQSVLRLETIRSTRYNKSAQSITLVLESGMARFSIPKQSSYRQSEYRMRVERFDGVTSEIVFQPGGTYRVRLLAASHPGTLTSEAKILPATEVVVESGEAQLVSGDLEATVGAGKRAIVDKNGAVKRPTDAEWQLIRDGDFSEYTVDDYNCTTLEECPPNAVKADTWTVRAAHAEDVSTGTPVFRLANGPVRPDGKKPRSAQFIRTTGNQKGFKLWIYQEIGVDVTPYKELELSADLLIVYQELARAGNAGLECPISLVLRYLDAEGTLQQVDFCYYAKVEGNGSISADPWIKSLRIPEQSWTPVRINLHESLEAANLPPIRRVEEFRVVANGHNYDVQVANISLVAR